MGSDKGSGASRHSKPTRWDMRPLIPLIQPRRDVTREMRPGGSASRLTAHQPIPNAEMDRQQRDIRDHQKEEEWRRQIPAGMAEQLIFLPFLLELTPMTPMQPQRIVDQTHTEPVDMLIQKSA